MIEEKKMGLCPKSQDSSKNILKTSKKFLKTSDLLLTDLFFLILDMTPNKKSPHPLS